MRIGIDIDGVLANFFTAYEDIIVKTTKEDRFKENRYPDYIPQTWNWPQEIFGYTNQQIVDTWNVIKDTAPQFWLGLKPLDGIRELNRLDFGKHDVYFITDRPGVGAKMATERWLNYYAEIPRDRSTVIISRKGKGCIAYALDLDFYVDDKPDNILDVQLLAPDVRAYLSPTYTYNNDRLVRDAIFRETDSLGEVFDTEGL